MKEKIFAKLKQAYTPLGLGDDALMARAELLDKLGFVTEENLDSVVASQKADLEGIQRLNDKRAHDAQNAEAEKARKAAEAAKAESDKQLKALQDELKALKDKSKEPPTPPTPPAGGSIDEEKIKALIEEARKGDAAKMEELQKSLKTLQDSNKELSEYKKAAEEAKEAAAKLQAANERKAKIEAQAKELGIPEYRIKEGFAIAEDATDDAIKSTLGEIANNIKVNQLPNHNAGGYAGGGEKVTKEDTDKLAANLLRV